MASMVAGAVVVVVGLGVAVVEAAAAVEVRAVEDGVLALGLLPVAMSLVLSSR